MNQEILSNPVLKFRTTLAEPELTTKEFYDKIVCDRMSEEQFNLDTFLLQDIRLIRCRDTYIHNLVLFDELNKHALDFQTPPKDYFID